MRPKPLIALLAAALAAPVAAQPKIMPPGAESRGEQCEELLQSGGFDNRYELIGGMTRVTACSMRGLVAEDQYQRSVSPRLQRYISLCYSADEQPYLRTVVRRGVVQAMPYLSQEGCDRILRTAVKHR